MEIISEKVEDGIVERRFDMTVDGEVVPGIHWLPEKPAAEHATILIGHGGTQHKRVPNVLGLARQLVSERGYGVVALDAPGHGDRMTDEERAARAQLFAQRQEGAGGRLPAPSGDRMKRLMTSAPKAVKEWKALLDELQRHDAWSAGPFGYWGVSMGTSFGIPLLASEPRITAAVLGLNALRPGNETTKAHAEQITIPLLFLFQWHDELMTRESGIALWEAFGSSEKTMHINPGPHVGIPLFERDAASRFFARHFSA